MKTSRTTRLLTLILVLGMLSFACQTVTNTFTRATSTSNLGPIPTQPHAATPEQPEQPNQPEPIFQPEPTPTLTPLVTEFQLEIFQQLWEAVNEEYLYP